MSYACSDDFCPSAARQIPSGQAHGCSRCGCRNPMHEACCQRHITQKHNGKATSTLLPEPNVAPPTVYRG